MQFDINAYTKPENAHPTSHDHNEHADLQTTHHTQALNDKSGKFSGGNGFSVPTYGGIDSPELIARKRLETGDSESFSQFHSPVNNRHGRMDSPGGVDEESSLDGTSADQVSVFVCILFVFVVCICLFW
jgi:hypothetical protein